MTATIIRLDPDFQYYQAGSKNTYQPVPLIRTSISFNAIMNQMRKDFQNLVQDKGNPVTNVGISTNQKFLDILKLSRNTGNETKLKAFLCPLYTSSGGISGNYQSFSEAPIRAQKKMESYQNLIDIIQKYIPLQITFLLADRGISITDSEYCLDGLESDIAKMRILFNQEVKNRISRNTQVRTFTEIGVPIDRVTQDSKPTIDEVEVLFQKYGIDFSRFKNQYQILAKSFGDGGAFSICRDYLAESRYTAETDENSIYLNVESCSPMNTLYQIGVVGKRLIDKNLYIGASYRV